MTDENNIHRVWALSLLGSSGCWLFTLRGGNQKVDRGDERRRTTSRVYGNISRKDTVESLKWKKMRLGFWDYFWTQFQEKHSFLDLDFPISCPGCPPYIFKFHRIETWANEEEERYLWILNTRLRYVFWNKMKTERRVLWISEKSRFLPWNPAVWLHLLSSHSWQIPSLV